MTKRVVVYPCCFYECYFYAVFAGFFVAAAIFVSDLFGDFNFRSTREFYVVAVLCIDVVSAPLYSSERYTRSSNCSVLLLMRVDISRCHAAMIYVWTEGRIREFDSKD